jgi:tellurite methyltransferase
MTSNRSIAFFDEQFQRQVAAGEFALNPFEQAALPYLRGAMLDLGCGLGNLSIEAARRGMEVVAVDASETAVQRLERVTATENLNIRAVFADMLDYQITGQFDTIVAIGLLMFFPRAKALALLADIQQHVAPHGLAIVNVLVEGTTYLGLFDADHYYLFGPDELERSFKGWEIVSSTHETFTAPGATIKAFSTVVARKP